MRPEIARSIVLQPVAAYLETVCGIIATEEADTLLLAIATQESERVARRQFGGGPARGLWQFEPGGGCVGVLTHPRTRVMASRVCSDFGVPPAAESVCEQLASCDALATAFARLLLFTDPYKLPTTEEAAWAAYMRLWRPGRPRPEKWARSWSLAQPPEMSVPGNQSRGTSRIARHFML